MTRKAAERIIKKIGESHVVWFPESNRWIEFREPAWFIYHNDQAGVKRESLIPQLSKRYGLPEMEAQRFYDEITEAINVSARPDFRHHPPAPIADAPLQEARLFSTRHYLINNKHFTISYGSRELEHYIHRPLAWLETVNPPAGSLILKVYENPGNPLQMQKNPGSPVRMQENPGSATGTKLYVLDTGENSQYLFEDSGYLKHRLYVLVTSYIYGVPEVNWMSYIHASAVTNGREALLLSSASGSGKSTLAAMLQLPENSGLNQDRNDLFFMSDDFVPVDSVNLRAHVFPAALTMKKGSYEIINRYYNPADDADVSYGRYRNPAIRYLRPRIPQPGGYDPAPVKKIVFISYNPRVEFEMEKLPVITALSKFHEEAWVSHNPGHARRFIDWFATLSCYRIEYSDNVRALQSVRDLFDRD